MLTLARATFAARPVASHLAQLVLLCNCYCASSTSHDANIMFAQRLNPATGAMEWAVVDVAGAHCHCTCCDTRATHTEEQPVQDEPLLASTSYTDMLNDDARNRAYRRAIEATVQHNVLLFSRMLPVYTRCFVRIWCSTSAPGPASWP